MEAGVVIVGAGQAGFQAAASLRVLGYEKQITLVGEENDLPYQRPPLSKAYILGMVEKDGIVFRQHAFFERNDIRLLIPERASRIDRTECRLHLTSGRQLSYTHLVLATGTRTRMPFKGADLDGVYSLRSLADAYLLRERLKTASNVVVIGAGFIGMEFAAAAAKLGVQSHVIESAPRSMARAVSPQISAYFTSRHMKRGTAFSFNENVTRIEGCDGKVTAVTTTSRRVPADMVLICVGVVPNIELAADAGLVVDNGIVVDEFLLTADRAISAIGDCAVCPNRYADGMSRIESVQNAIDQGRTVAARIMGNPEPYSAVPWFWSDQGEDKLQIAGVATGSDSLVVMGEDDRFSVFSFRGGALVCVESVNMIADHMAAKTLLKAGNRPSLEQLLRRGFNLKSLVGKASANT